VQIEIVERPSGERPSGRRFGTLVHGILATIDLDAHSDGVRLLAASTGRLVGASDHEVEAATAAVIAALNHPTIRRASASARVGGLRRETPVALRRSDGTLIEGVVDLAFREGTPEFTGWTVVDFKTDREFEAVSDQYVSQVHLYSVAVAEAMGVRVRGIVLVV
jgi:ATP-dependent exoDNAse (exonuclease V) beta subunit